MNIAVVGDVHGHLALMYAVLGRWQKESGRRIDVILQCGDMGAFTDHSHIDQATARWAEDDPDELGFAEFARANPPATLLDPRPPLIFIPGNHEDFIFLDEREQSSPANEAIYSVSEDGRISALKSGRIWTFECAGERARVAGISGVANRRHKKGRHLRYHLSDEDALRLAAEGPLSFDILISHDCPDGLQVEDYRGMSGSPSLRFVIEETQPRYAFFAHYDRVDQWKVGATQVFGLGKCSYERWGGWPLTEGGIAIINWDRTQSAVERLDAEWLTNSTRFDWRHWGYARS
ncbi:MAG: metallophosphoesterase [Acidobacteriota bacterium]